MAELDTMIAHFDRVADLADRANLPAYVEQCACGGSITVNKTIPAAERRRMHGSFLSRHARCTEPFVMPGLESAAALDTTPRA